ncbi:MULTISPECIES: MarR family winged helix-turn-helix transcriptional regulator [unclassified Paenibacillus]|uniref:MarR family winged helix-turn-helix transcriptional regulator n=1 Tax=unclassified Paenibacillus TaxID=185978 RepID=UPI00278053A8|nr:MULTISPECIES: MarR family transcriptional regulator [unclassified Paenibacillus]MDQ0899058.1 MarR family 2-MHQ and catechol resistance regulon transcriptional repressor [Paenibacillus sp. V4I7]MDQ0914957.1 MarR family 2-MHQ and catechol resistance regulon transcriptional repressor [Paenibacillus sp. V4I5]
MADRDAEGKALDLRLIRVINNAMKVLFVSLERAIDSYGLSLETFRILEFLYNKGPHSIQIISDTFSIPSGSITYVVDKLEKKGFVERLPIPGDRRKTNVALTGEGRRYFDNIFPKHVQTLSDNLSFATDGEKLELIHVLKKIGYGIKNREGNTNNDGSDSF